MISAATAFGMLGVANNLVETPIVEMSSSGRGDFPAATLWHIDAFENLIPFCNCFGLVDRHEMRLAAASGAHCRERLRNRSPSRGANDENSAHLLAANSLCDGVRRERHEIRLVGQPIGFTNCLQQARVRILKSAHHPNRGAPQPCDAIDLGVVRQHKQANIAPQHRNGLADRACRVCARDGEVRFACGEAFRASLSLARLVMRTLTCGCSSETR